MTAAVELSIVMPCLNEAETLATCIRKAHQGAAQAGVKGYEIVVADNGSSDGSQEIAAAEGARVVAVPVRGYGAALQAGIQASCGQYVLMGDSDNSYDFSNIRSFVEELRKGYTLVMGTRLKGEIKPDAMPILHRRLGNPILTLIGNLLFQVHLSDFHCGMRAFDRQAILDLDLHTKGMEYASEMVIRVALAKLTRTEVPITYYPDGRSRPPHLRTWSDGWRHLRFMLLYSPAWTLLYPGAILAIFGFILTVGLMFGSVRIGAITFDIHTMIIGSAMLLGGVQLVFLAIFTRVYTSRVGLLPPNKSLEEWIDRFTLGSGMALGLLFILIGIGLYAAATLVWSSLGLGPIFDTEYTLRIVVVGTVFFLLGLETFFASFVLSILGIRNPQ